MEKCFRFRMQQVGAAGDVCCLGGGVWGPKIHGDDVADSQGSHSAWFGVARGTRAGVHVMMSAIGAHRCHTGLVGVLRSKAKPGHKVARGALHAPSVVLTDDFGSAQRTQNGTHAHQ